MESAKSLSHKESMIEKETEVMMMMMIEKKKKIERDRLSELPDCVLLYIMSFMDAKYAVQTCVLSKRWKDLWKRLTNLTFHAKNFLTDTDFSKFVYHVLSNRDDSMPLLNLDFKCYSWIDTKLLNRIMKYPVNHNVQQLRIRAYLFLRPNFRLSNCIFSCQSLTSLKLCIRGGRGSLQKKLPKSLQLPAIKNLHLENFTFIASDNDCVEPFSTCNMLNTLVLRGCSLHIDANVFCISNSNLFSLILSSFEGEPCKIMLSTPNLCSFTIESYFDDQLSSMCSLSFLEEVDITLYHGITLGIINNWLQVLANVKILSLFFLKLQTVLDDLSNPTSMITQPPRFVRLESLKMQSFRRNSDEMKGIAEYLLQNSPSVKVDLINW